MRIARIAAAGLLVACGQPAVTSDRAADKPPVIETKPIDVARVDSMIRATVADKHLVGLSVGVAQNGKVVLAKGYGVKTLGSHDTVTAETMFAIGSVTKQFTCSAVLLLAQDGKLSMHDP